MTEGLGDFFGEGGGGAPAISWKKADKGDGLTGTILPWDLNDPTSGYETTQSRTMEGALQYWNPDRSSSERKIVDPGGKDGAPRNNPVKQAVITLQTDFRNFEFVSARAKERATEDGRADDGIRRLYVSGKSLTEGFRNAMKTIGVKRPEPGFTLSIKVVGLTMIGTFEAKDFEVSMTKGNATTAAQVAAYLALKQEETPSIFGGTDDDSSEPPF